MPFEPVSATLPRTIMNRFTYRERILEDIRYWIVPGVILVADVVMNDYIVPEEEMNIFVEAWNGRPITIDHPRGWEGANSPTPDVPVVGKIYRARWDNDKKRVQVDFWFEVAKMEKIPLGRDLMRNIRVGNEMEVSTGYWAEFELKQGTSKGKHYNSIHRNLRPDHVAILLAGVGACSLADGCGLGINRNAFANCDQCKLKTVQGGPMAKQKFTLAKLKELLPGVFGNDVDANMEVEFDPTALLSEEDKTKLTATNTQPTPEPKAQTPQQPATPELPKEITEFAAALQGIGGADGFKALLTNMQVANQYAENARKQEDARKAVLVQNILGTGQTVYNEAELKAMGVTELEKLAQFVGASPQVNFMGMSAYVSNESKGEALMPMPNWMTQPPEKKEDK